MAGKSSVEFAIESIRKAAMAEQAHELRGNLSRVRVEGSDEYRKGFQDCVARVLGVLRASGDAR